MCILGCFGGFFNILKISIRSNCSMVSFSVSVGLFISLSGRSVHWYQWGVEESYYYWIPFNLSLYVCVVQLLSRVQLCDPMGYGMAVLVFMYLGAPILGCIYINKCNIFFLYWSLYDYVLSLFIFLHSLCFKVCFIWYEYCYPHFLIISVCKKYLFPSTHFKSMCVLCPKVDLIGSILYAVLVLLSNLSLHVFWSQHFVHWHLR